MLKMPHCATLVVALILTAATSRSLAAPPAVPTKTLIGVLGSDAPTFEKVRACQQLAERGDAAAVPALAALLADEKLATYARSALEATADPSVGAALRDALGRLHGPSLAGAINSLGARRDAQAVAALQRLAGDEKAGVAEQSLAALGRIATPEAVATLRETLARAKGATRLAAADAAMTAAARLAETKQRRESIALLDAVRAADVPETVQLAATHAAILARGTDDLALLRAELARGDDESFATAVRAARRLSGRAVSDVLLAALAGASTSRKAAILVALGQRADVTALPVLQKAVATGPQETRLAAIRALAARTDAASIAALAAAIGSDDRRVAEAARAIMNRHRRANHEVPELLPRLAAAKTPAETAAAEKSLREACDVVSDPGECARQLQAAMAGLPPEKQAFLVSMMGLVGGGEALRIITEHARHDRGATQDAATEALGRWMTVDAAPALLDLAKALDDDRLRTRALRGYLRIARQLDMTAAQRLAMCETALAVARRDHERLLAGDIARFVLHHSPIAADAARARAILAKTPHLREVLFDGQTFTGWEGDTKQAFRIESGAIVGGSLKKPVPHNAFLCFQGTFNNFVLRAECRLIGPANGGIQFRSQRVPHHYEVSGYQADMSAEANGGYWGCLYDESRRNRVLAAPDRGLLLKTLKPRDWNQYEIRCEGPHLQLFLNGVKMVDYTEQDTKLPASGIIGVQIHGGGPSEAWYRNITIERLP
jgi:hypothetical protein